MCAEQKSYCTAVLRGPESAGLIKAALLALEGGHGAAGRVAPRSAKACKVGMQTCIGHTTLPTNIMRQANTLSTRQTHNETETRGQTCGV